MYYLSVLTSNKDWFLSYSDPHHRLHQCWGQTGRGQTFGPRPHPPTSPPPLSQLHLYIWMANIQPCNYEWICECVYVYVCEQKTLVILPFHIHLYTCWENPAAGMQPSFDLCERGQLRNTQLYAWGTVHSVHCLPFYQRRIRFTCFPAPSLVYVKCIKIVYDKRRGKKLDFHSQ